MTNFVRTSSSSYILLYVFVCKIDIAMCVPKYSVVLSLDIIFHENSLAGCQAFSFEALALGCGKASKHGHTQVAGAHSDGGDGDGICSKTFVFRSPGVSFRAGVSRSSPCAAGYVPHETRASYNMSTWW